MILDLFAGPGGWDEGLRLLGRTDVLGVEIDKAACATAIAAGHQRMVRDLYGLSTGRFSDVEGIIASPPCQGFSAAGNRDGLNDIDIVCNLIAAMAVGRDERRDAVLHVEDTKSLLLVEPIRFAYLLEPAWMVLEEVPAVRPVWEMTAAGLRAMGYRVWTGGVDSERYGVPQTRRREVLIAHRHRDVAEPEATHSRFYPTDPERRDPGVPRWVSMREALDWREPGWWFLRSNNQPNSARRPINHPAPTIAGANSTGDRVWINDCSATMPVTVRDAAVLQSFPADYPWRGRQAQKYKQIGNAVPPLMASAVLRQVL